MVKVKWNMEKRGVKIKIDEYKGPLGTIKGFELTTGKVSYGDETEWEPMGPHRNEFPILG